MVNKDTTYMERTGIAAISPIMYMKKNQKTNISVFKVN